MSKAVATSYFAALTPFPRHHPGAASVKSFRRRATLPLCLLAGIAACSSGDGGTGPTVPDLSCSPGPAPTVMNAGEYRILNPNLSEGCLRLPAAAASGAEYLVAALSTAGQVIAFVPNELGRALLHNERVL